MGGEVQRRRRERFCLCRGDSPNGGDGGDISLVGGAVWLAGSKGGSVFLEGGVGLDANCIGGDVNLVGGRVRDGLGDGDGGSVNIESGVGVGAGKTSGDINLIPADGEGGASAGEVNLHNTVKLADYTQNGILSVGGGIGTIISNPYGRQTFNIPAGNNDLTIVVVGAFIGASSMVQVTIQAPAAIEITRSPHVTEINAGADFRVSLKANNGGGGAVNGVLHWLIIG